MMGEDICDGGGRDMCDEREMMGERCMMGERGYLP